MGILNIILTVVFMGICLALTVIVLMQESKSAGLSGSIAGAAESYWGKNKSRSMEGKLETATKLLVVFFFVIAILLSVIS